MSEEFNHDETMKWAFEQSLAARKLLYAALNLANETGNSLDQRIAERLRKIRNEFDRLEDDLKTKTTRL